MSAVVALVDGRVIYHGKGTNVSAGTALQLSATPVKLSSGVTVRARAANAGIAYVGSRTTQGGLVNVTAANAYDLAPGESVFIEIDDLSKVWFDTATTADGVSYIAT